MADSKRATNLVVALTVAGIMLAFLMPVAIGAISGPDSATYTQATGETVEPKDDLLITVSSVTDGTSATYNVTYDGTSSTGNTVSVGSNSTVTVNGVDVTITTDAATTTNATSTYEYPTTTGWDNGAASLWGILPVIFVLAGFLFVVGMALKQF